MTAMATTYQPLPRARILTLLGIVLVWLVALTAGGSAPFAIGALALAGAIGLTWLFGARFAHTVTLDGDLLIWRSLLRRGQVPLGALRRLRPTRFEKTMVVIEGPNGRGPFVAGGAGIEPLLEALRAARADLPVELGR